MKITKKIAREIIFPMITHTGSEKLLSLFSGNTILNVMYHGVVNKDSSGYTARHIDAKQFEKQLKYYRSNFELISVREAFERHRSGGNGNRKTLTISFDDGYLNNLTVALPLIEKHEIPATFFISGFVAENKGNELLYADVLDALRFIKKNETIRIDDLDIENGFIKNLGISLLDYLKSANPEKRDHLIRTITEQLDVTNQLKNIDSQIWQLLDSKSLVKLSQSRFVEIGSHGHNHYNLGLIPEEFAKKELIMSKNALEQIIQKDVDMIAYPDGCYNSRVKELAEQAGYIMQLAVEYKLVDDVSDRRILPRHGISSTTTFDSNMIFLHRAFKHTGF